MNASDKIQFLIEATRKKQNALADYLGMKPANFNKKLLKSEFSAEQCLLLARYFRVDVEWLIDPGTDLNDIRFTGDPDPSIEWHLNRMKGNAAPLGTIRDESELERRIEGLPPKGQAEKRTAKTKTPAS